MRSLLFVVVALLIPACNGKSSIHSREIAAVDQKITTVDQKIVAVDEKITALTQRIDEIGKQVKEAKEIAELPMHERMRREHERQFQRKAPDTEALAKIDLPENPTRAQVNKYVQDILAASAVQNMSSPTDPQHEMLMKIGSQNLDVLVDQLGMKASVATPFTVPVRGYGQNYLLPAIERLATADHKSLIIEELPNHPELMPLVEKFGWQNDARDAILKMLAEGSTSVPYPMIPIIARMKDPKTYPALLEQLAISDQPAMIYAQIKDLPGIELDEAVRRAWSRLQGGGLSTNHAAQSFAPIALAHGEKDALGLYIDILDVTDSVELHRRGFPFIDRTIPPRRLVLKHIDFHGTNEQITEWYEKNYHDLKFDKERKVFYVEGAAAAQS